ncbi:hypothetical protein ACWFZ6_24295 [Methylorubrum extorquens]
MKAETYQYFCDMIAELKNPVTADVLLKNGIWIRGITRMSEDGTVTIVEPGAEPPIGVVVASLEDVVAIRAMG